MLTLVRRRADLEREENRDKVGVLLGLQNPKALSDSLRLLDAFFDLGLRCLSLAFNENSYYGCGYACEVDTGLTSLGKKAIKRMNRTGHHHRPVPFRRPHGNGSVGLLRPAGDLQPFDQPDVVQPARAAPPTH